MHDICYAMLMCDDKIHDFVNFPLEKCQGMIFLSLDSGILVKGNW
jgi:hypothetical protein